MWQPSPDHLCSSPASGLCQFESTTHLRREHRPLESNGTLFPSEFMRGRSLVCDIPDNWLHYFCCGHEPHFHKEHQQMIILSSTYSLAFSLPAQKYFHTNTPIIMTENSSRTVSMWSSCKSAPGRTFLTLLQTGLNDPPKQSAVKTSKCSHRPLVWNQPDTNVMYGWLWRACLVALKRMSQQPENQGEIQIQPCSKWSSGVAKKRRNEEPEAVDWLLQQHCAPAALGLAAWHGQVTANELQRAELLLIDINVNPPLLHKQSYNVTFRAGASHHEHHTREL